MTSKTLFRFSTTVRSLLSSVFPVLSITIPSQQVGVEYPHLYFIDSYYLHIFDLDSCVEIHKIPFTQLSTTQIFKLAVDHGVTAVLVKEQEQCSVKIYQCENGDYIYHSVDLPDEEYLNASICIGENYQGVDVSIVIKKKGNIVIYSIPVSTLEKSIVSC